LLTKGRLPSTNRRKFLASGAAAMSAPWWSSPLVSAAQQTDSSGPAKRCIFIFLCGGPSQLDMWDPKPEAPDGVRSTFDPLQTNVPGMHLGGVLPQVARHADKLAIIRSMTHESSDHGTGIAHTLLADSKRSSKLNFPPQREDQPGLGGILQSLLGKRSDLPAWVTVPRPFTTGARMFKGQTGGFLGPAFDPFFLDEAKRSSLADKRFEPPSLTLPQEISQSRLTSRRQLLAGLNDHSPVAAESANQFDEYHNQAFSLLSSSGAGQIFDVGLEAEKLRDRYGRNEYGQSFLLARRLVESGVRMVNVFWTFYGEDGCQFNLWDNHGSDKPVCGGYNKGIDMLTAPYCCPAFDTAYSALLEDLSQRGMLEDTLVVVTGEFGRTPKINKNAGRDHWPNCYSTVLAGGGVTGGRIYGESDSQAGYVKESPVRPEDLGATVLHGFGVSSEDVIYGADNRPLPPSRGTPVKELFR